MKYNTLEKVELFAEISKHDIKKKQEIEKHIINF